MVVRQNGADVTGSYAFALGPNDLSSRLDLAFINKIDTQFSPTSTATNLVNTYSNPLRLRARWDASWSRGPVGLNGAVNYSNAYTDTTVVPYAPIASWTTVDLSARFNTDTLTTSVFGGATIQFNVVNLLNRYPPYANGAGVPGVHYDVGNASPLGRFVSVELKKKW